MGMEEAYKAVEAAGLRTGGGDPSCWASGEYQQCGGNQNGLVNLIARGIADGLSPKEMIASIKDRVNGAEGDVTPEQAAQSIVESREAYVAQQAALQQERSGAALQ